MSATVNFVIPTYNRPDLLRCMLASLVAQSDPDWSAHVVMDSDEYERNSFDSQEVIERLYCSNKQLKISYTGKPHNDWGHTPRDKGRMESTGLYTIMTGDDNYYVPKFVEEFKKALVGNPGFVYWDMVHSSFDYQYFKCTPGNGQIDIGAFAVRTDLCKQVPLGRDYAADGQFVEDYKKMFPHEKMVKINKILYVHN